MTEKKTEELDQAELARRAMFTEREGEPDPTAGKVPLAGIVNAYAPSSPVAEMPPPQEAPKEPLGMLDLEEPPETYGIDEVAVLARDPFTLFAYWEVTGEGRARARGQLGADGQLTMRFVVHVTPGHAGEVIDHDLTWDHGRRYFPAPRSGNWISALVGLKAGGRFAAICESPRIKLPYAEPGPDGPIEWMEVVPARSRGRQLERPQIVRQGPASTMRGARGLGFGPAGRLGRAGGQAPYRGEVGGASQSAPPVGGPSSPQQGAPTSPGKWGK